MNDKRWIVIGDGTPQCAYVGKTDMTPAQIEGVMDSGESITLHETRRLQTIMIPTPKGIQHSTRVISVEIHRGGVDMILVPTSYYEADATEYGSKTLLSLIAACEGDEERHRAADAGIVIPGQGAGANQL